MKTSKMLFLALIIAALWLSACGGGADTPAPAAATATRAPEAAATGESVSATEPSATAAPTQSPATATPEPAPPTAEPPTAEPTVEQLSLSAVTEGLGTLSSYKSRFYMKYGGQDEEGKEATAWWEMQEEFTREPRARRMIVTSSDLPDEQAAQVGTFEIITIGDTSYMTGFGAGEAEASCIAFSSDEETPADETLYTPDMLGGISGARYVGTDSVNGVRAKHYTWKESGISFMGMGSAEGEVWVAADGEYVVRYTTQATGEGAIFGSDLGEGTITVEYDLTDVNSSFTIEPPPNCEAPTTDIPVMADAQERSSFGNMLTYSSPSPMADVVDFYKREMKDDGWSEAEGGMEMEELAMLNFTKDGRSAQLMISYDPDEQLTSVMITTGEE